MIVSAATALPTELWLVVQPAVGDAREVAVDAAPTASVRELAEAIAAHVGFEARGAVGLFCKRTQSWLPPEAPVVAAGLRSGDTLVVGHEGVTSDWSTNASRLLRLDLADLVVVGGPRSGERFGLSFGDHVVGRDGEISITDPSLSREHLRISVSEDSVTVVDLGSRNGTAVEGVLLQPNEPRELHDRQVVEAGRTLLAVERPQAHHRDFSATTTFVADPTGRIPFNRPPRVEPVVVAPSFEVDEPPEVPQKTRLPLAASVLPAVMAGALAYMTKRPEMLLMAALTPAMAIASFVESRRSGKGHYRARAAQFAARLSALEAQLEQALADERERRRHAAPSAPDLLDWALHYRPTLWQRRPEDDDFLRVRVGTGQQPAQVAARLPVRGDEKLRDEAAARLGRYSTVSPVPVTLDLPALGGIGVVGRRDRVDALARWLVVQAAVLQSPRDVVVAAALHEDAAPGWEWLKWLPHTHSDTSPLPGAQLTVGHADGQALIAAAAEVARSRRDESPSAFGGGKRERPAPFLVLVVDEKVEPSPAILTELLADPTQAGIGVVWLGSRGRDVPGGCRALVEAEDERATLAVTDVRTGVRADDVTADGVDSTIARTVAMALAPVRDTSSAKGRGTIPRRVPLPELLGLVPTAAAVTERWQASKQHRAATVGVSADGPVRLDLREDGPHALVAGTTGAGKSELLQTLVAALAVEHPPNRMTFLLIDYKGGAAFKECIALPHTVGFVTDLDEHLTHRALVSLNAELRLREEILGAAGAKDLVDMERRDPEHAPPSLVIIVDEFATLAKEVPDFVAGVVDVAQRGRSLGVHLVLATQRPGGVVSENIRANTNLRIALRVNNPGESSDVIGSDLAARIQRDTPGRAYVRMGHSELIEFQTAFVGGVTAEAASAAAIAVRELSIDARTATQERAVSDAAVDVASDLERIVEAARAAAAELAIPAPVQPWMPALPEVLPLDELPFAPNDSQVPVALLDDPARQRRLPYSLDLARDGSVLVYGAGGSGKTTLLRTAVTALARTSPSSQLQVYGLDFGSRGLQVLEALPHVGSIVPGDDDERVTRLFALLRREVAARRERFARLGVFDLEELRRRAPEEAVPRLLVLVDGYAGFTSAYERVNMGEFVDLVPRLVAEGRPLGIHFLITGDRRGAIPSSVAGVTPRKLAFRMADDDDLVSLGFDSRTVKGAVLPPGRMFVEGTLEAQVAVPGLDGAAESQAAAIAALADLVDGSAPAPPLGTLPPVIPLAEIPAPSRPLTAVVGIGDSLLAPVELDLSLGHVLVAGPYRSGRSTALRAVAASVALGGGGVELLLMCPRRSPLLDLDGWAATARGVDECGALAKDVLAQLDARSEDSAPIVLVVDDADQLAEGSAAQALDAIVRRGRDLALTVVAAGETQALVRAFGGWLREMRKDEQGLLLDPTPESDGDLLGVRLPRRPTTFAPGRGYLVSRGQVELLQVAS